ncbi:MAG: type pilus assembly protein PilB [Gaiellaceae bacterium]|nr:type pilus assembly protein PilB [Gaiellaceae bacterium]
MSATQRPRGSRRTSEAARTLADEFELPFITLVENELDDNAYFSLPEALIRRGTLLPYRIENGRLQVAVADPSDVVLIDELRLVATMPVDLAVAPAAEIARLCAEGPRTKHTGRPAAEESDTAAVRALDGFVADAIEKRASDVHLLPTQGGLEVRFRIDGIVSKHSVLAPEIGTAVISRLKVIASLDIAEHRAGQDGRFATVASGGQDVDVRVATLPTIIGEGAVLRLLKRSRRPPSLTEIGMSYEMQMDLERFTGQLGGAVVVAGPTGSGKSTTLYATLADLTRPEVNIITIEDPVEYRLPNVYQLQVNRRAEFTFARALRTILRADPDIVMVGEIRDRETATISIEAALTGHLLLTTLHAKDAPSAIMRLIDLGVEPFLLGSALGAVIAQRLARRLCTHCKEAYEPSADELAAAGWEQGPTQLWRPGGCDHCDRGYDGRIGLYELLPVTGPLMEAILRRGSFDDVVQAAETTGRTSMWSDGLQKVAAGDLSLDELRRVLT